MPLEERCSCFRFDAKFNHTRGVNRGIPLLAHISRPVLPDWSWNMSFRSSILLAIQAFISELSTCLYLAIVAQKCKVSQTGPIFELDSVLDRRKPQSRTSCRSRRTALPNLESSWYLFLFGVYKMDSPKVSNIVILNNYSLEVDKGYSYQGQPLVCKFLHLFVKMGTFWTGPSK